MTALKYMGALPLVTNDLAAKAYPSSLVGQGLTQPQVDALQTAGFSTYATKTYVDAQDAYNATQAYIDTGDVGRLHLSQKGANNGVAPLDATAKMEVGRIPAVGIARWPSAFWSPAAYNNAIISAAAGTSTQLYTCQVADPGYNYKLLIMGQMLGGTNSVTPTAEVRAGSTAGALVAYGLGRNNPLQSPVAGPFPSQGVASSQFDYTPPTWCNFVDAIQLGGGGGGTNGGSTVYGSGGSGGYFTAGTWARGTDFTTKLFGYVGAGGPAYSAGEATWVWSDIGSVPAVQVSGGSPGVEPDYHGASPGSLAYGSHWAHNYAGGADQYNLSFGGNWPGGGAAGGGVNSPGGPGAAGQIWYFPYAAGDFQACSIQALALSDQPVQAGALTLYVMLKSNDATGSGASAYAHSLIPALWVATLPA